MSGPEIAATYLDRLYTNLATLRVFPDRGTKQTDGSRRIGFERRIQVEFPGSQAGGDHLESSLRRVHEIKN